VGSWFAVVCGIGGGDICDCRRCLLWYDGPVLEDPKSARRLKPIWRAVIEMAFIIFLFYSNLLMGEFESGSRKGKSLVFALNDIFTETNFAIAVVSALVGYIVFEQLRKNC
jgi:hypothetical protein